VAKRRQLKGITQHKIGPDAHLYQMREKTRSPIQASMRTEYQPTYQRWSALLDVPQGEKLTEYRLAVLATNVAADAAAAGAMGVAIRPQRVPVKAAQTHNTKQFHKLTAQLKELDYGYCLDGGASAGGCKVWYMKTVDTYGEPIHARSSSYKAKKPKPVQAELGPAEDAFGPSAKPAAKPKKPKKLKRPTKGSTITIAKEKREFTEALKKANDSKGKRCKVLAKEKGYTISECNAGFSFKAYDKLGKEIGRLDLTATGNDEYKVSWSGTHESTRGERVGTALYEAAAEAMCKSGKVLTSDTTRSRYSEKFWAKQATKGRATCVGGDDGDDDSMSREQAYEEVYNNYLSEAESEYIESGNYEEEATDAYFESNDQALSSAKEEHISNNDLRWETYEAYFEANEEARSEAVSEYVDSHEDEFDISEEGAGGGSYYGPPWQETVASFNRRISEAPTFEAKEKLREELQKLDKKLPPMPQSDEWPCRKYRLDASMCEKSEIDLGRLPAGHMQRKANKCPPGYRKHKAKNGMVSCKPVRRRKR
jgi:hypothetical protein